MKPLNVKTEVKIIAVSLLFGLVAALVTSWARYSENVSQRISDKFIRLHVVANSDSDADQQLKLAVRDGVLAALAGPVYGSETIGDARAFLAGSLADIESEAQKIIDAKGYNYTAKASLEKTMFPTRQYGDVTLVAGAYEALRIEIGEADGKNWWCVVYPPLCYVDVAQGPLTESVKEDLKSELEGDYPFVVNDDSEVSVEIRFKVVELWQESKNMALAMLGK